MSKLKTLKIGRTEFNVDATLKAHPSLDSFEKEYKSTRFPAGVTPAEVYKRLGGSVTLKKSS